MVEQVICPWDKCNVWTTDSHFFEDPNTGSTIVVLSMAFFTIQRGGEFPHEPFYLPQQPFDNSNAPSVFCPFQLRSVTDELHVRIM